MCKKALEHSVEVSVEMSLNGLLCMLVTNYNYFLSYFTYSA